MSAFRLPTQLYFEDVFKSILNVTMPRSEIEYVLVVERKLSPTERFLAERKVRLARAHQSYLRIIRQFAKPKSNGDSARKFRALRFENRRRHELCAARGNMQLSRTSGDWNPITASEIASALKAIEMQRLRETAAA